MYGECNNQQTCNAIAHYDCPFCKQNLCAHHYFWHRIKFKMLGRCYLWYHHN